MTSQKVKKLTILQKNVIKNILELMRYKGKPLDQIALYRHQYVKVIEICTEKNGEYYLAVDGRNIKITSF